MLGEVCTSCFYEWNFCALHVVSISASSKLAPSASSIFSVVTDVESSPEEVVEVCIDVDVPMKKVADRSSDPRTYRRETFWLAVFQVTKI